MKFFHDFSDHKPWDGLLPRHGFDKNNGSRLYAARRSFYKICREKQLAVAALAGETSIKAKAQLSPFFMFSEIDKVAEVAIGATLFLEYEKQFEDSKNLLIKTIKDELAGLGSFSEKTTEKLTQVVAGALHIRLTLEALARQDQFKEAETFRVLTCNLMDPVLYSSVEQVVRWALLYDDLLPDTLAKQLNPGVRDLFNILRSINGQYSRKLQAVQESQFINLSREWAVEIFSAFSSNLHDNEKGVIRPNNSGSSPFLDGNHIAPVHISMEDAKQHHQGLLPYNDKDEITDILGKETMEFMASLVKDLHDAAETPKSYDDPKPDHMITEIVDPFSAMPEFEGELREADYLELETEDGLTLGGEVMEESLPLSYDSQKIQTLQFQSEPISAALKKILYTSSENVYVPRRATSGNGFISNHLPLHEVKDMIFRKYALQTRESEHGKPYIIVACDGSGSMNGDALACLQLLTAAWSMLPRVRLLAGLYTTIMTPQGSKPIIRWVIHPKYARGATQEETLGRVASIPEAPMASNEDAIALFKILAEAKKLSSTKDNFYLVHITDTAYNGSFQNTSLPAIDEIDKVLKHFKSKILKNRLHVTLVALADKANEYKMSDQLCHIPTSDFQDFQAIAERINQSLGKTIITNK